MPRVDTIKAASEGDALLSRNEPDLVPAKLTGPLVWSGEDFQHGGQLPVMHLSKDEVCEIQNAALRFKGRAPKHSLYQP